MIFSQRILRPTFGGSSKSGPRWGGCGPPVLGYRGVAPILFRFVVVDVIAITLLEVDYLGNLRRWRLIRPQALMAKRVSAVGSRMERPITEGLTPTEVVKWIKGPQRQYFAAGTVVLDGRALS